MHKVIRSHKLRQPSRGGARPAAFRQPHYDCWEQMDALKLVLYVPGVNAAGVDLEVCGPDLCITAPRSHVVRAHWRALHLEPVQRDYQLRLRLGFSLDYKALHAELHDGVLTIIIPKKSVVASDGVAA
jgi:HSP20 family protein